MFKSLLENIVSIIKSRLFLITVIFLIMFALLIHKLFDLQIVNGETYLEKFTYRIKKETEIESPRGSIYDANGYVLAEDVLAYSITIEDTTVLTENDPKNTMIYNLIQMIKSCGSAPVNNLPLTLNGDGSFSYKGIDTAIVTFKRDIFKLTSNQELNLTQREMNADDLFEYMRGSSLFDISDEYTTEEAYEILAIRYELFMKRYTQYLSVEVATDINDELIAKIKENRADLPGVEVKEGYKRQYSDSEYFAHITGYTGQISQKELDNLEAEGYSNYSLDDTVGKTGIEQLMEHDLAGEKGSQTIYVNSLGSILDTDNLVEAVAGNNIYLSIDKDLQMYIYDMLEAKISGIILVNLFNGAIDEADNSQNLISINEIYSAFINNNIIDLEALAKDDASELEKSVNNRFTENSNVIIENLQDYLTAKTQTPHSEHTAEYKEYFNYIYTYLVNNDILYTDKYDSTDSVYAQWSAGNISIGEFLYDAISNGWINTEVLLLESEYPTAEEVYNTLIEYIIQKLPEDTGYKEIVYNYMLKQGNISGVELCILLYEQGVLKKDNAYEALKAGTLDGFNFVYTKIENMEITPDMLALDTCSASCVVTDPNTGEVKALVSYPSYDANKISDTEYYTSLLNNNSKPLYNRATQQNTAPGSTFKMISSIGLLEEGVIDTNTLIQDNVTFTKIYPSAKCWSDVSHGKIGIVEAITVSCNYFFYESAYRMGLEADDTFNNEIPLEMIRKYASMFGLDETSGIELYETEPNISDIDGVRSMIGQGTHNYTAVQLARYVTAVANKGDVYSLSLLDKVTDSEGNTIQDMSPELIRHLEVSENTWSTVIKGMHNVTLQSQYKDVFSSLEAEGIKIAAKSGTAEENSRKSSHALYVGFAPYEAPELAVVCVIPYGYTSGNVADALRDVVAYYLDKPLYNALDTGKAITPFNYQNGVVSDVSLE